MSFELSTPAEIAQTVGHRVRELRLQANLTQAGLADRAAVSTSTVKRFEESGQITFHALIRVAVALNALAGLEQLFAPPAFRSLDEIVKKQRTRKRGRKK